MPGGPTQTAYGAYNTGFWYTLEPARPSPNRVEGLRFLLWPRPKLVAPTKYYERISKLRPSVCAGKADFPTDWADWHALRGRFNQDDELPLSEWFPVVDTCVKNGWGEPSELDRVDPTTFSAVASAHSIPSLAHHIWKDDVIVFADTSSVPFLVVGGASVNAEFLNSRMNAASVVDSEVREDVPSYLMWVRIPKDPPT